MNQIMLFLNSRWKGYSQVFFVISWILILINILFSRNWIGIFGKYIGHDFVCMYAAGLAYRQGLNFYDPVIYSKLLHSFGLGAQYFLYPPIVAETFSVFTFLSPSLSFLLWSLLMLLCMIIGVSLISKKFNNDFIQTFILIGAFLPIAFAFKTGQFTGLIFLLVTYVALNFTTPNWKAGVAVGILTFKPQFALGFLIAWLLKREFRLVFIVLLTALIIHAPSLVMIGPQVYFKMLQSQSNTYQYALSEVGPMESTVYAFGLSLFHSPVLASILVLLCLFAIILLFLRGTPLHGLSAAILFPYIVSPHILFYDLTALLPVGGKWLVTRKSDKLRLLAWSGYIGVPVLLLLSQAFSISFLGLGIVILVGLLTYSLFVDVITKKSDDATFYV